MVRIKNTMFRALSFISLFFTLTSFAGVTITRQSSSILYRDNGDGLYGFYTAYNIENTGATNYQDLWVDISNFTGGVISKAPNEDGIAHLGALSAGQSKVAFFYLQSSSSTSSSQTHDVSVYESRPPTTALATTSFSMTSAETISANANKVNSSSISVNPPALGGGFSITVVGETGTIGAAKVLAFTPASIASWPANKFELKTTQITLSGANTGVFTDKLLIPTASITSTANTDYTAVYTFNVTGTTTSNTSLSPAGYISSGTQIKHTSTGDFASLDPILPAANNLTISVSTSPTVLSTAGTIHYTITLDNDGSTSACVDSFHITLPTSPDTPVYASNSTTFESAAAAEPVISGQSLSWYGVYCAAANDTAQFEFDVDYPSTNGIYESSSTAEIGSDQIDSSLDTTSDNDVLNNVVIGTVPDLSVTAGHTGNFTQGNQHALTIAVVNVGTADTSGTITVTDTLPSGLTYVSASGAIGVTNWSCSAILQIVTCTNTAVLAVSESSTITLTVDVDGSAASSLTNSASASTTGDINTSNDTDSDTITVVSDADATITLSHSGSFIAGAAHDLTITVENIGTSATSGTITVTNTLPTGLTYASASGTIGATSWVCSALLQVVTCTNAGSLAPSASSVITLSVNATTSGVPSVVNSATVDISFDANSANNSDTDTITVLAANAGIDVQDTTITAGSTGSLTTTISNVGNAPTQSTLTLVFTLPSQLSFVSGTGTIGGTTWSCAAVTVTVTCTNTGSLSNGSSENLILTLSSSSLATTDTVSATLTLSADISGTNNADTGTITITAAPPACSTLDVDGDGLTGCSEDTLGTDPNNPDSDGDSISDGDEVTSGTNPSDGDSDDDGLSDGDEQTLGTNPLVVDTDGDNITDGDEGSFGSNPLDSDSDDDGLSDGDEQDFGSDPNDGDSDDDGLGDQTERTLNTNPKSTDTDGDGLSDSQEITLNTNPNLVDTDNDGIQDGIEVNVLESDPNDQTSQSCQSDEDSDLDGLSNCEEIERGMDPQTYNGDIHLQGSGSKGLLGFGCSASKLSGDLYLLIFLFSLGFVELFVYRKKLIKRISCAYLK